MHVKETIDFLMFLSASLYERKFCFVMTKFMKVLNAVNCMSGRVDKQTNICLSGCLATAENVFENWPCPLGYTKYLMCDFAQGNGFRKVLVTLPTG